MGTKMCIPGKVPVDVADDSVEDFLANGYVRADGSQPEPAADDSGSGLSEAEVDQELSAVAAKVRREGEDKGLEEAEIDADVEAAVSKARAELEA